MGTEQLLMLQIWTSLFFGVVTGAALGLFFHREDFLGGYQSFRRRLLRLGHISFFGIAALSTIYLVSLPYLTLPQPESQAIAKWFLIANVSMPLCCALTAWRKPLRHLFPIPVLAAAAGIVQVIERLVS